MSNEIKQDLVVHTHDFHNAAKIDPMTIREWHSRVFDKINNGESQWSISSGNSKVFGYRSSFENTIVIQEFISGYYEYSYPQPEIENQ